MSRQLNLNQLLPLKSTASHRINVPVHRSILNYGGMCPISMVSKFISRELSGQKLTVQLLPIDIYSQYHHYRKVLCHHDVVHCALFDNSGKYFITGSYDTLVKIWSTIDGRLLATLRGIGSKIKDIAIDAENSMIATGSKDGIVRIWCLQTSAPIAFLNGHTGTAIKDIKFCPLVINSEKRVLVSRAKNGIVYFWAYNPNTLTFEAVPSYILTLRNEGNPNAKVLSFSFSPGGVFMAVGSSDNYLRVYCLAEPTEPVMIFESNKHTEDVFSTEFSHHSTKFASGSKDGFVQIWNFQHGRWTMTQLCMLEKLSYVGRRTIKKPSVTAIAWTFDDAYLITTSSDHAIRVWNPITRKLCHLMRAHTKLVWLIECHPKDPRLFITAGLDGRIFLWDIMTGKQICNFQEEVGVQILDCRFSPDGSMFVTTNAAGELNLYGMRKTKVYKRLPPSMFFHTDYRTVIRDEHQGIVIDSETQIQTHRMPAPILADHEGFSHPNLFQRLVPGRENNTDQELTLAIEAQSVADQRNDEHRRITNGQDQQPPVIILNQNIQVQNDNQLSEWNSKPIVPKLTEMMILGHIKIQQTISCIELDELEKMKKAKQDEMLSLAKPDPLNRKELKNKNYQNKIIRQTNESDLDDFNLMLTEEDDPKDNDFIVQSNRVSRASSSRQSRGPFMRRRLSKTKLKSGGNRNQCERKNIRKPTDDSDLDEHNLSLTEDDDPKNSDYIVQSSGEESGTDPESIRSVRFSDASSESSRKSSKKKFRSRNKGNVNGKRKHVDFSSDDEEDGDFNILLSRNRTNKTKRIIRSSDEEDDSNDSDNYNILLSKNRTNKSKRIIRSSDDEEDDDDSDYFYSLVSRNRANKSKRTIISSDDDEEKGANQPSL